VLVEQFQPRRRRHGWMKKSAQAEEGKHGHDDNDKTDDVDDGVQDKALAGWKM